MSLSKTSSPSKFGTPYDFFALLIAAALIVPFFLDPGIATTGTTATGAASVAAATTGAPGAPHTGLHTRLYLPPCLFLTITGLPCPFCGLTTSFALLTHGHLGHAFLANPSGPLLYSIMLFLLITYIVLRLRGRENLLLDLTRRFPGKTLIIALAVMWIARLAVALN